MRKLINFYCADCKIFLDSARLQWYNKKNMTFLTKIPICYLNNDGKNEYVCYDCNVKRREKLK